MPRTYPGEVDQKARRNEVYFERSCSVRNPWMKESLENVRFYLGDQWSQEERKYLKDRARFPLTLNITAPVVDGFVALIAANSPRFKCIASNEAGNELAHIAEFLLEYIWYVSRGNREFVRAMLDYANTGIGWMMADYDRTLDYGNGEVVVRYIPFHRVHWDWHAAMPGYRDRAWTMVYNSPKVREVKAMFPDEEATINLAAKMNWNYGFYQPDQDLTSQSSDKLVFLPGDIGTYRWQDIELDEKQLPLLEMYEYQYVKAWSVLDPAVGYEQYFTDGEFKAKTGISVAVRNAAFQVTIPRVLKTVSIGGYRTIHERLLPVTILPTICFVRTTTMSAYPQGLTSRLKDPQRERNKRRLAIIENAMASAAGRIIAPRNAIDRKEYETYIRLPGGMIEYTPQMDATGGAAPLIPLQAPPLPNQFYYLDQQSVPDIEYIAGMSGFLWGQGTNMPETYRQTLVLEEYGNRRIKAIDLTEVEASLQDLGQISLEYAQWAYNYEKMLAIVDDEGKLAQTVINEAVIDEEGNVKHYLNDIRKFFYMVKIVSGSTMPINRYAQLEMNMALFDRGIIDEIEVLKKSDVVDPQAVIERLSRLRQAVGTIEELQDQIKDAQGVIERLESMLIQLRIKDKAREMALILELETLHRKMAERLARAHIELQTRTLVANIQQEEKRLMQTARAQTRNLIDVARAKIQTGTATSQ